jgi:hypothetical protein
MTNENISDIFLSNALQALAPLVQAALREGITYPQFAQALKSTFFDVARSELEDRGSRLTDSAISILSGVHRKDVKVLGQSARQLSRPLSIASEVYTRWLASPDTTDSSGAPLSLPRSGPAPSFDTLALSVTKNVHPRTVLEELLRLKLVILEDTVVIPQKSSFIPREGYAEMASFMANNLGDHAAAACANLAGQEIPFLEQSVFADGLTEESVELLALLARQSWKRTFDDAVALATQRVARDETFEGNKRIRLGVYFYACDEATKLNEEQMNEDQKLPKESI